MSAPIEECFARAFGLLQHAWIVDFLFSDNDVLFHNALRTSEKIYGTFAFVTDPTLPVLSEHDLNERGSMLFVSSFNRGLYTAGYEIRHSKKAVQAVTVSNRYVARIVRDDHNGQLFSVACHPDLGVTEIVFCHPQTPGHREQGMLMFRTDMFNNTVKNLRNGGAVDFKALKNALAYSFVATEWRQCPNCESFNSQFCGCAVESRLRLGPNDFHHDRDSLFLHAGSYNGVVNISMYALPGAPPLMQRTVRSSSFIGMLPDQAEMQSMCTWAMWTLNDRHPVDLVQMNILSTGGAQQVPDADAQVVQYDATGDLCLDLEDPSMFFAESDTRGLAVERDLDMTQLKDLVDGGERIGNDALCAIVGEPASIEALNDADMSTISLLLENNNADCTADVRPDITVRSSQSQQEAAEQMSQALAGATVASRGALVTSQLHSVSSMMSNRRVVGDTQATSSTVSNVEDNLGASVEKTGRRAVPIAPASGETVDCRSAALDANQIRLERRKARNRASAQRSNLKKKLAMQKMKEELAELSERESGLRVEEQRLREENLRLRAEMATVGR